MRSKMGIYVVLLLILVILTTNVSAMDLKHSKVSDVMSLMKNSLDIELPDNLDVNSISSPIVDIDPVTHIGKAQFVHVNNADKSAKKGATTTKPVSGACYSTFATWNSNVPVSYVINPKNNQGLTQKFITGVISKSAETWDAATTKELFNNVYKVDTTARYGKFDGKNSIVFGTYPYPGVIAVTGIWFDSNTGQIYEFDMKFNTVYKWGNATVDSKKMDLQNIATHELGHSIGLDDIYSSTCSYVTMYGYSGYGDTQKRDLASPDIEGLQILYP